MVYDASLQSLQICVILSNEDYGFNKCKHNTNALIYSLGLIRKPPYYPYAHATREAWDRAIN